MSKIVERRILRHVDKKTPIISEQQQWAEKIFVDSAVPILVEDLNCIVIDLNPEAERAYRFDRQDLIGKPIKTLVPHERHQQADDLLKRCLNGEDVRNIEGLRCARDGNVQNVLITLSVLKNESGEIVAVASQSAMSKAAWKHASRPGVPG